SSRASRAIATPHRCQAGTRGFASIVGLLCTADYRQSLDALVDSFSISRFYVVPRVCPDCGHAPRSYPLGRLYGELSTRPSSPSCLRRGNAAVTFSTVPAGRLLHLSVVPGWES